MCIILITYYSTLLNVKLRFYLDTFTVTDLCVAMEKCIAKRRLVTRFNFVRVCMRVFFCVCICAFRYPSVMFRSVKRHMIEMEKSPLFRVGAISPPAVLNGDTRELKWESIFFTLCSAILVLTANEYKEFAAAGQMRRFAPHSRSATELNDVSLA